MLRFLRRGYLKRAISINAVRKGLVGGSPFWRAVWVLGLLRGIWSKVSKRGEGKIAFSESLDEGDSWAIVHVPERSGRGRRRERRRVEKASRRNKSPK